jgi:integrase
VTKLLTAASAAKLKAGRERIEVRDGGTPGLYLNIYPTGQRSFAMKFRRPNGKLARFTLGYFDPNAKGDPVTGGPLSLQMARALAADINRQRATGIDIIGDRHRSKLEKEARGGASFSEAAMDFVNQHSRRHNKAWRDGISLLGLRTNAEDELELIPRGLADRWRDKSILEINGDDIHFLIDEARERAVPGLKRRAEGPSESMARALHSTLSKMFSWLISKRRLKVSPVAGVAKPRGSNKRHRVLTDDEIKKFWAACDEITVPIRQCLKVLLLTGCRVDEIRELRRDEISDDGKIVTIPGSRTKNKLPHVLPLSEMVRTLIESVKSKGDFIFTQDGKRPAALGSQTKDRLDSLTKMKDWQFRDLRRTVATGMADIGIMPHVIEACLNHISGAKSGVAGTYNRAQYKEEKRMALERWSAHVEGIIKGRRSQIIQLQKMGA